MAVEKHDAGALDLLQRIFRGRPIALQPWNRLFERPFQ
jgi:hypothetical protein